MKRCLFALAVLFLSRILFIFYLFNYFQGAPLAELPIVFLAGVLFDIQALVYFLAPFHLISLLPFQLNRKYRQFSLKFLFVLGLMLIVLFNFIDMEFYKVKSRRSGIELFELISDPSNPVLSYIFNYWWLLIILLLAIYLVYRFYPKGPSLYTLPTKWKATMYFFLISACLALGARGSFSVKPLRSFDAAAFVDARWVSACINSPTQLITSYSTLTPSPLNYFSDEVCFNIVNPIQTVKPAFGKAFQPNIVLIILESFGRDYCGFLNNEPRYTPFLDSLSKEGLVFLNAYSSGNTSMESVPAIFASIPSLLDVPYINSNFQNNRVKGIHHYLSNAGYDCSFYYGARNGSMGFDNFLNISGKINYFGLDEYPRTKTDFDGSWGIWDEEYLHYFADELSNKKPPFFSSIFTLTSHDPYKIPQKYKNKFVEKDLPIHKAITYTDYALKTFFQRIWKNPQFNNTIFIITADHPSHSKSEYFYTPTGKYEIPIILYAPKLIQPGFNLKTSSHLDIFPTIMRYAGIEKPFFSFGRDLNDSTTRRTALNMDYGVSQIIEYPYCLRLFPNNRFLMHYQSKQTLNKHIRYQMDSSESILQKELEIELKARYQLYINSLLYNRFNNDAWQNGKPIQISK
ncbi:MAG: sulfatase-like hydrolase/transferase [Bacteroidia bacterium]|nr:sulfatase-like hydrolase/transferase [Bacteroidia bacterium]